MTCFDVGANIGFFSVLAARLVGPTGRVISFEPFPANAQQIAHNARLNGFANTSVRAEALGGSNRTEVFCTSSEPTWGKLANIGREPDKAAGQIGVNVRTLDSLCGAGGLPYPDFIKMDIEGAEVEALEGALNTLATSRPVLEIELHGTNTAVMDILDKLDYRALALGAATPVREAEWNVNIVAIPAERADLAKAFASSESSALA
jgi:FkbM family methyltransferase